MNKYFGWLIVLTFVVACIGFFPTFDMRQAMSHGSPQLSTTFRAFSPGTNDFHASAGSYHTFFDRLLASIGHVGNCVYEPEIWDLVVEEEVQLRAAPSKQRTFLKVEPLLWSLNRRFANAPTPNAMSNRAEQLRTLKLLVSIAVDRIRRDRSLQREYDALADLNSTEAASTRIAFEHSTGNAVAAIFGYAHTVLQTVSDIGKKAGSDGTAKTLEQLCELSISGVPKNRSSNVLPLPWMQRRMTAYRLDPHSVPFEAQTPRNGRFWNGFRPSLGCSGAVRLCERPDGCRNSCNVDFMLHVKVPVDGQGGRQPLLRSLIAPSTPVRWSDRPMDFVGFGSNNEFDWEESIVGLAASRSTSDGGNPLRAIVSFDCTLKSIQPSRIVLGINAPGAFGFLPLCLDKSPSAMSITMAELKPLLVAGKRTYEGSAAVPIQWFGGAADAMKEEASAARTAAFGELSILKVDVEGYEFGSLPQWLRDDLALRGSKTSPEDMDRILQADQLQMELHRMGHKGNAGTSVSGTLQTHLLLLYIYALGFIPVSQERNHADNCCYEFTSVSSRFYVMSEAWMIANRNRPS